RELHFFARLAQQAHAQDSLTADLARVELFVTPVGSLRAEYQPSLGALRAPEKLRPARAGEFEQVEIALAVLAKESHLNFRIQGHVVGFYAKLGRSAGRDGGVRQEADDRSLDRSELALVVGDAKGERTPVPVHGQVDEAGFFLGPQLQVGR